MFHELITFRIFEVGENERAEVILLILVRIVVGRVARIGEVLDGPDVLHVGRVLAFAGHPDHLAHHLGLGVVLDVVAQVLGHVLRQLADVGVGLGLPTEDLVQLDGDARLGVHVAEGFRFGAFTLEQIGRLHLADLAFAGIEVEVAVDDPFHGLIHGAGIS